MYLCGLDQVRPGEVRNPLEARSVPNGHFGEHLAIDIHAGELKPMYELAVGEALQSGGRVDAGDPETAHITLPLTAVPGRVGEGLKHGLMGATEQEPLAAAGSLCYCEDFLVSCVGGYAPFHPRHG